MDKTRIILPHVTPHVMRWWCFQKQILKFNFKKRTFKVWSVKSKSCLCQLKIQIRDVMFQTLRNNNTLSVKLSYPCSLKWHLLKNDFDHLLLILQLDLHSRRNTLRFQQVLRIMAVTSSRILIRKPSWVVALSDALQNNCFWTKPTVTNMFVWEGSRVWCGIYTADCKRHMTGRNLIQIFIIL